MLETTGLEREEGASTIDNLRHKVWFMEMKRKQLKDILNSDMDDDWKLQAIKANI